MSEDKVQQAREIQEKAQKLIESLSAGLNLVKGFAPKPDVAPGNNPTESGSTTPR